MTEQVTGATTTTIQMNPALSVRRKWNMRGDLSSLAESLCCRAPSGPQPVSSQTSLEKYRASEATAANACSSRYVGVLSKHLASQIRCTQLKCFIDSPVHSMSQTLTAITEP